VGAKYRDGTKNNLVGDLGYDRHEELNSFRAQTLLSPSWSLEAEYLDLGLSGFERMPNAVRYGNQVFPAGYDLDSDLDLTSLSLKVGKELYFFRGVTFRITGGVIKFDIDAAARSTAPPPMAPDMRASDEEWNFYTPTLGFYFAAKNSDGWQISAEGTGSYLKFSSDRLTYYDGTAALSYFLFDNLSVFAGYRYQRFQGVKDHGRLDLFYKLTGPIMGVLFRF
jgi:hypothetical protein